jgi:hypothetical protein
MQIRGGFKTLIYANIFLTGHYYITRKLAVGTEVLYNLHVYSIERITPFFLIHIVAILLGKCAHMHEPHV